jgi:hypothetical protein
MIKKFGTITSLACFGGVVAFAAAGQPAQAADSSTDEEPRFKQGEFDLSPFGTYSDQTGGKWGAGIAGTYFLFDNLGLGAATYWTDAGGTVFDNIEFEGYFRIPVFKVVAPYAVASLGYQFDRDYWFETVGAGVDFRAFKHITAFSDFQWRIANSSALNGPMIRLGARITF